MGLPADYKQAHFCYNEINFDGSEVYPMERLKLMLTGGLLVVATFYLAIFLMLTTISELQPVQADVPPAVEEIHYAQLTDAQPQRDISQQQFAPLAESQ